MHADTFGTFDDTLASGPRRTPLHALHLRRGARMVPFSGYDMPLHYLAGLLKEHLHTRARRRPVRRLPHGPDRASRGRPGGRRPRLEALIPADILGLRPGRQRYGLLTDAAGGIRDDLMVARFGDRLVLVVNAANKAADLAHLRANLPASVTATPLDRALVALQGPAAEAALARLAPAVAAMRFMDAAEIPILGHACLVTRSGYTGEDGFEISVPVFAAEALAEALLADGSVMPAGLGARDSLRLEAGLCLHGSDIGPDTTPTEAGLAWAIPSVRRAGGGARRRVPGRGPHARRDRRRPGSAPRRPAPRKAAAPCAPGRRCSPPPPRPSPSAP